MLDKATIVAAREVAVSETDLPYPKHRGKVRDTYDLGDVLLMVTTDRLSGFDRHLATIPFKGAVLNQVSAWWFAQTQHIVPNHLLEVVDSRSMRVKKCQVLPIEVIMRGYMTGTTNTSIWTLYQQGERQFFNTTLADGLSKNLALAQPMLTPTTKAADHDAPLTPALLNAMAEVKAHWPQIADIALQLFEFGQQRTLEAGLILVDTKYEFGLDADGRLTLIDECHTPDSSRYWDAQTYKERLAAGQEPDNFDKEIIRLWFRQHCDPYGDKVLPDAPDDLIVTVAQRYLEIQERLLTL